MRGLCFFQTKIFLLGVFPLHTSYEAVPRLFFVTIIWGQWRYYYLPTVHIDELFCTWKVLRRALFRDITSSKRLGLFTFLKRKHELSYNNGLVVLATRHICQKGHAFIGWFLAVRQILRQNFCHLIKQLCRYISFNCSMITNGKVHDLYNREHLCMYINIVRITFSISVLNLGAPLSYLFAGSVSK